MTEPDDDDDDDEDEDEDEDEGDDGDEDSTPPSTDDETVAKSLASLRQILDGTLVKSFVADVEETSNVTGMTPSIAAVAQLISRVNGSTLTAAQAQQKEELEDGEAKEIRSQMASISSANRRGIETLREESRRRIRRLNPPKAGEPSDAQTMTWMTGLVKLIPLEKTREDPSFTNVRLHEDPLHPEWASNEGQHISDLVESIGEEGVKVPIIVEQRGKGDQAIYLVRAGYRRRKACMKVGLTEIPAVVMPEGTPMEWQYWANILENTARKSLATYEIAVGAQRMRDRFGVKTNIFAKKTGFTPQYVGALVGAIDRLPHYLIEQWRDGARVTVDQWITLSHLEPDQAIKLFRKWMGFTPQDRMRQAEKNGRNRPLAPPKWLDRMQRLYIGIEGSDLAPRTRDLCLRIIEHCQGARDGIPGVYEPGKHKKYAKLAILRNQLKMPDVPEPGENKEMPPPREELESQQES